VDNVSTRMYRVDPGPQIANGHLIVIRGPAGDRENRPGKTYTLGHHATLGRQTTNSIVLPDDTVSREHCSIATDGAGYRLHDPGSANGTLVDGKPIREGRLEQSADIHIGDYRLFFWNGSLRDDVLTACLRDRGVRVLSLL
jgi:pSer/pThr/pTyr-binding forkhead associated (FHA) protein